VHKLPAAVAKDLAVIFPSVDVSKILAIPTCQHARVDLVRVGPDIEEEKDRLLETFMGFASQIAASLVNKGFWVDYIDPCSGLAVITTETSKYYDEVSGMQSMLKYNIMNAGCCKILLHPVWGSSVYPATIFTTAPFTELESVIRSFQVLS
jgi:Methylmalonic aciduria and homocystinuria type D protein